MVSSKLHACVTRRYDGRGADDFDWSDRDDLEDSDLAILLDSAFVVGVVAPVGVDAGELDLALLGPSSSAKLARGLLPSPLVLLVLLLLSGLFA